MDGGKDRASGLLSASAGAEQIAEFDELRMHGQSLMNPS
jgi:hypothetical protein